MIKLRFNYYLIIILLIFLCGCSISKKIQFQLNTKLNTIGNHYGIGNHPYQSVGKYETNSLGYVSRIILNKGRIKEINEDKYYIEIIIKTGE